MFDALVLATGTGLQLARSLNSLVPAVIDGVLRRTTVVTDCADGEPATVASEAGCDLLIVQGGTEARWHTGLAALAGAGAVLLVDGRVVLDRGWSDEVRTSADRGAFDGPRWAAVFESRSPDWRNALRQRLASRFGRGAASLRSANALIVPRAVGLEIYGSSPPARRLPPPLIRLRAGTTVIEDPAARSGGAERQGSRAT